MIANKTAVKLVNGKEIKPTTNKTTKVERTLADCEKVISTNVNGFRAMGAAFKEIRDKQLYTKGNYGSGITFEKYCLTKWNMSKQYVYRLISASEVIKELIAAGVPEKELPNTPAKANALKPKKKAKAKKGPNKDVLSAPSKAKIEPKTVKFTAYTIAGWREAILKLATEFAKNGLDSQELFEEAQNCLSVWNKNRKIIARKAA